jgi:hypothetical protein
MKSARANRSYGGHGNLGREVGIYKDSRGRVSAQMRWMKTNEIMLDRGHFFLCQNAPAFALARAL